MPNPPRLFSTSAGRAVTAAGMRVMAAAGSIVRRVRGREPGGMERLVGNADHLLLRELPALLVQYRPDVAALREVTVPWVLATGRDSVGRPYRRPAHVLAGLVGVACVEFPGGHLSYQQHPQEFSECLATILDELATVGSKE
jgi:hypothetical protein